MLTALEFTQVPADEAAFRTEIRLFLNEALKYHWQHHFNTQLGDANP